MRSLLLVRLLAILSIASTLRAAQPANDSFAGIAPKMQEFVDKGEVSGIVTLVANKDRVLHLAAVGKSDLATGRKMEIDDLFWIASMSKPVTAVGVALLVDDGKLSFDDPVQKYLPEFAALTIIEGGATNKPARAITLRDVLTHTSGLGEFNGREPHLTLDQTAKMVAKLPLRFQPGSRWGYSTAGIDVLGRVVEVVSGMPFDQFLQKRLFDPLGMKNTTFWLTAEQEKRFAHNYRMNPQTNGLVEATIAYLYGTADTDRGRPPLGGAGLFSTAEDVGRFYQMILNGGTFNGQRILKAETVAEMLRVQTGELRARPGMPWGLGFCVVQDPKAMEANTMLSPGSYGHGGAHGTSSWVDPKLGAVYVIMLQRAGLRNPDNSDMHRVFQEVAAVGFAR